jgi:predicted naringenin-chalcone synthase
MDDVFIFDLDFGLDAELVPIPKGCTPAVAGIRRLFDEGNGAPDDLVVVIVANLRTIPRKNRRRAHK